MLCKNHFFYINDFRFTEIENGYSAKRNQTAINRVPLSALLQMSQSWMCYSNDISSLDTKYIYFRFVGEQISL